MADTSATTPGPRPARSESATLSLIIDMADTTWRMFVPTVGLLLVGHYLDIRYHTKPWLMLVGVGIGALVAALLVKRQVVGGGKH